MDSWNLQPDKLDFQLLLVTTSQVTHRVLELVLDGAGLNIACEPDASSAVKRAATCGVPVVLTTPDVDWKCLIHGLQALEVQPSVIVMLPDVDAQLWAEALNLGAYDAIVMGSKRQEILATIASAHNRWERRKSVHEAQIRNPLAHSA